MLHTVDAGPVLGHVHDQLGYQAVCTREARLELFEPDGDDNGERKVDDDFQRSLVLSATTRAIKWESPNKPLHQAIALP